MNVEKFFVQEEQWLNTFGSNQQKYPFVVGERQHRIGQGLRRLGHRQQPGEDRGRGHDEQHGSGGLDGVERRLASVFIVIER